MPTLLAVGGAKNLILNFALLCVQKIYKIFWNKKEMLLPQLQCFLRIFYFLVRQGELH